MGKKAVSSECRIESNVATKGLVEDWTTDKCRQPFFRTLSSFPSSFSNMPDPWSPERPRNGFFFAPGSCCSYPTNK